MMNPEELLELQTRLEKEISSGVSTEEIEQWADEYCFNRGDLIDLIRTFYVPTKQARNGV